MEENPKKESIDVYILVTSILLWLFGLVVVYTASNQLSIAKYGTDLHYLKNQLIFSVVGILAMILCLKIDLYQLRDKIGSKYNISLILMILSFILLCMVFVPGLSHRAGNATRWINLKFCKLQPSELLKICLVIYIANYMTNNQRSMMTLRDGFIKPFLILMPFVALLFLQPDVGTIIILCGWLCGMLFIGGARPVYLAILGGIGLALVSMFIWVKGYNIDRIMIHFNPWKDPLGKGFQPIHSMYAFALGGLFGKGPGESIQKLFYLPEPHTDYALSIVAEEFGFIVVGIIIFCFGFIIYRGIRLAHLAKDKFISFLAWGLTSMFALQVIINVGVATALFPPKGLTLPFLSYGGSSLVVTFASVGLLLNISSSLNRTGVVRKRLYAQAF